MQVDTALCSNQKKYNLADYGMVIALRNQMMNNSLSKGKVGKKTVDHFASTLPAVVGGIIWQGKHNVRQMTVRDLQALAKLNREEVCAVNDNNMMIFDRNTLFDEI